MQFKIASKLFHLARLQIVLAKKGMGEIAFQGKSEGLSLDILICHSFEGLPLGFSYIAPTLCRKQRTGGCQTRVGAHVRHVSKTLNLKVS